MPIFRLPVFSVMLNVPDDAALLPLTVRVLLLDASALVKLILPPVPLFVSVRLLVTLFVPVVKLRPPLKVSARLPALRVSEEVCVKVLPDPAVSVALPDTFRLVRWILPEVVSESQRLPAAVAARLLADVDRGWLLLPRLPEVLPVWSERTGVLNETLLEVFLRMLPVPLVPAVRVILTGSVREPVI